MVVGEALICIPLITSIIEHLKKYMFKALFCKLLVLSFADFSIGLLVNWDIKD